MSRILVVLALSALVGGPAVASDKTDALAPLHRFVDGFNKGDAKAALTACADETSILDDFAPHEWHGAGACAKWASDFEADATKNGITETRVTVGKPLHVDVTGDRAYVVAPANYRYKLKGKPMNQKGQFTVALQKGSAGWVMTGWTWANQ